MADFDITALPRDEFEKVVRGLAPTANTETQPSSQAAKLPPTVTPDTQAALAQANEIFKVTVPNSYVGPEAAKMGVRPGVFLNTDRGLGAGVRLSLGLDENQINQFKMLLNKYGPGNVDMSAEGRFVVRNQPDGKGGTEDLLVDPHGLDVGDAAQFAGQAGPMIAGAIGARLGGSLVAQGVWKAVAGTLGMAMGQELAGAAQDAYVRWMRGNEVDASEIAKHRAAMAAGDMVLGLAAAGGAKVMSKAAEGVAGLLQIPVGDSATTLAAKELQRRTGVNYPLTPGQASESSLLMRGENIVGSRPGTAGAIDAMRARQRDAEDELRRVFLDLPRTMSDEELAAALPHAELVGQRGLRTLGKEAARLEGNVAADVRSVRAAGTQEAQSLAGVDLAKPVDVTTTGQALRAKAVEDFQNFRADMGKRYEAFLSKPEINARSIDGSDVATAARGVEEKFVPAAEKGGVTTPLDKFTPAKFRSFVDELKSLDGAKVSVNDLKRIRTAIDNSIAEGVAIPGTDVAQLEALKKSVDGSITASLKGIDPALLREWQGLRSDYAAGSARFDRVGIREMLVREGEKGSLGNTKIAERVLGNSPDALDRYNEYKAFFGASSPEFQQLQAVAKQDVLRGSLDDLTGFVDGKALRARLQNTRPEISEELFGVNRTEMARIGEILDKTNGKLDTEELLQLAKGGSLTAGKLEALIAAETERAVAFNNKLIKAAAAGTVNAERIKPSEFVRYVTRMDVADAQRVLGVLGSHPALVQDIRQLAVEDIWSRVRAGAIGKERLSAGALEAAMGDAAQQRTWRAILGEDTVDAMKPLVKILSAEMKDFKGGLAGAADINRLALKGDVGEVKELATRFLLGFLYSGPLKKAVTNLMTSQDRGRFLNGVIASQPFIEGMMERFKGDAPAVIASLRDDTEEMMRGELAKDGIAPSDPMQLTREQFKKWLEAKP